MIDRTRTLITNMIPSVVISISSSSTTLPHPRQHKTRRKNHAPQTEMKFKNGRRKIVFTHFVLSLRDQSAGTGFGGAQGNLKSVPLRANTKTMDQKKSAAGTPISKTTKSDPGHKPFFLDKDTPTSEFDKDGKRGEHSIGDGIVSKKKKDVSRVS